ncbi:Polynucleotide adenylyltransferase region [Methylocella silvestris BL2]|uniref:Polynucleotide adenylyltransferase region n=1 Tax=Methylocella silvestris (strain DSM 15510 / CIP 108128 / LMG 27833 / NCIMB 13906 / BL2) TaxID=395965 RepID=B8ER15_METSB|nr:CCA tRNA nucleotidyltransferase [Methylocella silvestris]ACK49760.1 Polynucleotide adenylyltransferase region [Methylocella silvestris BL2]
MTAPDGPGESANAQALALLKGQPGLQRIFAAIDIDGDETRIVGGAVRNALLGRKIEDIDLATTAAPPLVIERARAASLRIIPTGLDHGTVTLLVDGRAFEVTSLREDIETDGRRATVRFGRDFCADALRRDFTINALFLDKSGRLFDFVGALADIEARRVRFIGDPETRIREDYLRILRFFRFSADYGEGPIDGDGLLAAMRARAGLAQLSRERVRAELLKLVAARRAPEAVEAMSGAGLLGPLIASAPNPARLRRLVEQDARADPLLRLAAICLETPEDAERIAERLRLSNAERDRLSRAARVMLALHGKPVPPPKHFLNVLLFRHGRESALDGFTLAAIGASSSGRRDAIDFLKTAPEPRLPFSGADLIARGFSGRAVGDALAALRERWIEAEFSDDREKLDALLDSVSRTSSAANR